LFIQKVTDFLKVFWFNKGQFRAPGAIGGLLADIQVYSDTVRGGRGSPITQDGDAHGKVRRSFLAGRGAEARCRDEEEESN